MNLFEENMKKIFNGVAVINNRQYEGEMCYASINDGGKIKAEFISINDNEHYDGLLVSIMDENGCQINSKTIKFEDVWGKEYDAYGNWVAPYMCLDNGKEQWYPSKPTQKMLSNLSSRLNEYVRNFGYYDFGYNEGMGGMSM